MAFHLVTRVGTLSEDPVVLATLARGFLQGVVASNRVTMREAKRRGRPIPPLYESGVEYQRERGPGEEFADVLTVLRRGWGDCDDLVAWRIAELLEEGHRAGARIYWRAKKPPFKMHAQVRHAPRCKCSMCHGRYARGRVEDPSRFLGL